MHENGITIPAPCSAKWKMMPNSGDGRFCDACSKIVIDFRSMSVQEIKIYLEKNFANKVCGHFHATQIDNSGISGISAILMRIYRYCETHLQLRAFRLTSLFIIGSFLSFLGKASAQGEPMRTYRKPNCKPTIEFTSLNKSKNETTKATPGNSAKSKEIKKSSLLIRKTKHKIAFRKKIYPNTSL
jgi:hypothetical protein